MSTRDTQPVSDAPSGGPTIAFDLDDLAFDDLALDVFEVENDALSVEALTGAHGMTELGASACCPRLCSGSCCCCTEEEAAQEQVLVDESTDLQARIDAFKRLDAEITDLKAQLQSLQE